MGLRPSHQANGTSMAHHVKSAKQAAVELKLIWHASSAFLLSIEVWLIVVAASATVAGFWLAFMADWRAVPAFAGAFGYPVLRVILHQRRLLSWPFM